MPKQFPPFQHTVNRGPQVLVDLTDTKEEKRLTSQCKSNFERPETDD